MAGIKKDYDYSIFTIPSHTHNQSIYMMRSIQ